MKNKKKYPNGGPLLPLVSPVESLAIKPLALPNFNVNNMMMDAATMMEDFNKRNPIDFNEKHNPASITENWAKNKPINRAVQTWEKSKGGVIDNNLVDQLRKMLDKNKPTMSTGGQILSTLAGFIPGIGGVLSPAIGLIDQTIDKGKLEDQMNYENNKPSGMQTNTRIYGNQMAEGGNLSTKNFKQYSTGTHASGNDMNININGVPTNNNVSASIQGKENAYTTAVGQTYVYSDVLKNPETKNKFNTDAMDLNKKFNKADVSVEDRNALEFGMKRLSILNDKIRSIKEQVEMATGGNIKKLWNGGNPNEHVVPPADNMFASTGNLNDLYLDTELSIPPTSNMMSSQPMGELIDPAVPALTKRTQDLSILPPTTTRSAINNTLPNLNNLVTPVKPVTPKSTSALDNFDYNIPSMVLKGFGLAKSAMDALTPAEVEKPILTNYDKSDQQMYATNIDYTQAKQDALAASNLAGNVNRSASGSFEQYQGRQANNFANYADSVGRVSMKEALDRNQQYVQRAGYEQNKAVDKTNRLTQNKINNQMNQANADLADQKFFSELTDVGSQFNKYEYYEDMVTNKKEIANATINEGLALIGVNNTNFGLADDFMNRIRSGTASVDELVKFMSVTEKVKSETKTKK